MSERERSGDIERGTLPLNSLVVLLQTNITI